MSVGNIVLLGLNSPNLLVTLGYQSGGDAPPAPPIGGDGIPPLVGPALTPAQRKRWFSTSSSVFESPVLREARRQALERLTRIELGILPPEPEEQEEVLEELETLVSKELSKPQLRSFGTQLDTGAVSAVVDTVVKAVMEGMTVGIRLRRAAEEEEEEAIVLFLME